MKLIAMISTFYEDEHYVEQNMIDLHSLGVDTVVIADGCYSVYPGEKRKMTIKQVIDLHFRSEDMGLNLLVYSPHDSWLGNEVEKRQTMLDLAWTLSENGDWFVVWDCDYQLLSRGPRIAESVRARLDQATEDFATVSFTESSQDNGWHEMQMFIRAQPVVMDGNHHTYKLADGRRSQVLRRPVENMAEALDLGGIRVRHRVHERDPERRARQTVYHEIRDREGLEA